MSISEYQLLNKVLDKKDYHIITDNFVTKEDFEQATDEFEYIKNFYDTYNCIPDKQKFSSEFPDFEYFKVEQSDSSIIDDMREKSLFRKAVEVINDSSELFTQDANKGAQYLLNHLDELQPNYTFTCTDIIHDTSRYDEWKKKTENRDDFFIPSGFPELDEYTFGWKRGEEFALVMARSGVGKSFFAVKSAQHALSLGYTVGFVSPEISANTLGYRFDSANAAFSNTSLLRGDLVKDYDEYIDAIKQTNDHFYVTELKDFHNEITVPKLKHFCKSKSIDILFIDGFDYISDTRAKRFNSREDRMGHVAQDLVTMSIELNIPVVGMIQSNRKGADDDKELGTENITGADKIGASCTRLIALRANGPAMQVSVPKNRYGRDKVKVLYQWDIDRSKFFFIPDLEVVDGDEDTKKEKDEAKKEFKNVF